jgi:hypothetical protein
MESKLKKLDRNRYECRDCGDREVRWEQRKDGKWYVAQVGTKGRANGKAIGPHYPVCQRAQQTAAHNAAVHARAEEREAQIRDMLLAGKSSDEIVAAIYGQA